VTFAKSFEELRVTCQSQQGNTAPSAAFGPAFRFPSRLTPVGRSLRETSPAATADAEVSGGRPPGPPLPPGEGEERRPRVQDQDSTEHPEPAGVRGGLLRKDSGHRWGNTNEEGASLILRLAGLEETGIGRLPAVPGVRRARADGISCSSIRDTNVPAS